jgi:hypothetical protein
MDEQADEYTSDASWYGWLDQWHDDYPQPQDNNKKKCKRSKTKIGVFGIIIVVLLIGVSIAGWGSTLKTSGSNSTAGWGSTSVTPIITTTGVTVQTPKPVTTSADSKPLTCEEKSGGGKLVTGKGATITSPETLIAEFQHRYFDLRDGTAVAELWDDGYTAEGFQATIDQSLKGVDDVQWCVTVMPGSKGWWVTEVKWWEPGDINPRETWLGNYKIEKRNSHKDKPDASEYIFTDAETR